MSIVTIVGAGMMGTAMCWPLADNGHTVRLVGTPLDEEIIQRICSDRIHPRLERKIPEGVQPFTAGQLPQAIDGASLVIGGVSSFGVDWFASTVGPYLTPEVPVISVTKGLEDQSNGDLEVLPVAMERKLPPALRGRVSLNAIGGPCIAHELAARRQTAVVFCGKDARVLESIRSQLLTPYYHIWTSTDMVGVEVCAAMKNAYALGVGLAVGMMEQMGPDGLAHNYNPQAALFGESCLEMRRLLKLLGGGEDNIAWLPGAGDLYVTVFGGRTVALGKLLGKGLPFAAARQMMAGATLESVEIITRVARALPRLEQRGLLSQVDFPLLLHLDEIINRGAVVGIPWERFFESQP
jgi:glycerol-3-phosphate dehydrogenase (NAD(P)+)